MSSPPSSGIVLKQSFHAINSQPCIIPVRAKSILVVSFAHVTFLCLDESRAHQLINMSTLHSALILVTRLEQDCEHFDRRIESQSVGSSPALDSGNANAGLQCDQRNVRARETYL